MTHSVIHDHLRQHCASHLLVGLTPLRCHHSRRFFKCTLKLLVCILLDSLSVLQLLDQLHLQLFHLHNFFFLLLTQEVLIVDTVVMVSLYLLDTALTVFFNLHDRQSLLLSHDLILHAVLLFNFEALELLLLFVLLLHDIALFGFFSARLENCLLNFSLLILSHLVDRVIVLSDHPLVIVRCLIFVDFPLNPVLVTLLEREDLVGSLLGIIDLFPGLVLFLLQKCDSVS